MRGCYLIHFETPLHHARHYLGYADDIARRLRQHRAGRGARLMAVVSEQGIDWQCVRVWVGEDRHFERRLKNRHESPRLCPVCRGDFAEMDPATAAVCLI